MQIVCIDRNSPERLLCPLLTRIRNMLADLEINYPFFSKWLERVFIELRNSNKRKLLLAVEGDLLTIVGIAILKNSEEEKKICTLRVSRDYQRRGIGTALLKRAIQELDDPLPLITVSDAQINAFKPFLEKHEFVLKNKVMSLYRIGHEEYFFNKKYEHTTALISIKPVYASAIACGHKSIEFRKRIFSSSVKKVYVYSSAPVKRIIGFFLVTKIKESSPEQIWKEYSDLGCISKERYDQYFEGHNKAYGILIQEFIGFKNVVNPLCFSCNFIAPQSFCYLDNVEFLNWIEENAFA